MTQQRLDVHQLRAGVRQVGGVGVPELVRADLLVDAGLFQHPPQVGPRRLEECRLWSRFDYCLSAPCPGQRGRVGRGPRAGGRATERGQPSAAPIRKVEGQAGGTDAGRAALQARRPAPRPPPPRSGGLGFATGRGLRARRPLPLAGPTPAPRSPTAVNFRIIWCTFFRAIWRLTCYGFLPQVWRWRAPIELAPPSTPCNSKTCLSGWLRYPLRVVCGLVA